MLNFIRSGAASVAERRLPERRLGMWGAFRGGSAAWRKVTKKHECHVHTRIPNTLRRERPRDVLNEVIPHLGMVNYRLNANNVSETNSTGQTCICLFQKGAEHAAYAVWVLLLFLC